jgi:hypothetical protein
MKKPNQPLSKKLSESASNPYWVFGDPISASLLSRSRSDQFIVYSTKDVEVTNWFYQAWHGSKETEEMSRYIWVKIEGEVFRIINSWMFGHYTVAARNSDVLLITRRELEDKAELVSPLADLTRKQFALGGH